MGISFESIYDKVYYDTNEVQGLYTALNLKLDSIGNYSPENKISEMTWLIKITEDIIDSYLNQIANSEVKIAEETKKIEAITKANEGFNGFEHDTLNDLQNGIHYRLQIIGFYQRSLAIINERLNFLLPSMKVYNETQKKVLFENSTSKFHLIDKRINFRCTIIDTMYLVFALNINRIFSKYFKESELRLLIETNFREIGKSNKIPLQTIKNNFTQLNSEKSVEFTKNDIINGTNLGSLGTKNFNHIFKQLDVIRLIEFVNLF